MRQGKKGQVRFAGRPGCVYFGESRRFVLGFDLAPREKGRKGKRRGDGVGERNLPQLLVVSEMILDSFRHELTFVVAELQPDHVLGPPDRRLGQSMLMGVRRGEHFGRQERGHPSGRNPGKKAAAIHGIHHITSFSESRLIPKPCERDPRRFPPTGDGY